MLFKKNSFIMLGLTLTMFSSFASFAFADKNSLISVSENQSQHFNKFKNEQSFSNKIAITHNNSLDINQFREKITNKTAAQAYNKTIYDTMNNFDDFLKTFNDKEMFKFRNEIKNNLANSLINMNYFEKKSSFARLQNNKNLFLNGSIWKPVRLPYTVTVSLPKQDWSNNVDNNFFSNKKKEYLLQLISLKDDLNKVVAMMSDQINIMSGIIGALAAIGTIAGVFTFGAVAVILAVPIGILSIVVAVLASARDSINGSASSIQTLINQGNVSNFDLNSLKETILKTINKLTEERKKIYGHRINGVDRVLKLIDSLLIQLRKISINLEKI